MPKAKSRQPTTTPGGSETPGAADAASTAAAVLTYNEAQTALKLTLAALQANDLDVEEMTGLYRRARAYLERCESVLASVEQELLLWDGSNETAGAMPDSL